LIVDMDATVKNAINKAVHRSRAHAVFKMDRHRARPGDRKRSLQQK
jgi:hypothetical protein